MPELIRDDFYDLGDTASLHAKNADDLEDLADLMESRPWIKGSMLDPTTGGVCLMGGITMLSYGAVYPTQEQRLAVRREQGKQRMLLRLNRALLRGLVRLDRPPHRFSLTAWNDDDDRTKEQVLDLIRGTAKYERAKAERLQAERKSADEE